MNPEVEELTVKAVEVVESQQVALLVVETPAEKPDTKVEKVAPKVEKSEQKVKPPKKQEA